MAETQKEIEKLIKVYQEAQQALIRTIAEKEAKGNVTRFQKSLLFQVQEQIKSLNEQAKEWAENTIPAAYQEGLDMANQALKNAGVDKESLDSFARLHTEAIEALVMETLDDLYEANNYANNTVKQIVDQAVTQKIAQGQTVRECKNIIIRDLIAKGITGIETKNGKTMALDAYAALVAKSRTREATNTAMVNHLTALDRDLVKISSHNSSCPICLPLQGRIFSISGKDDRYPPLSRAFTGPYANIHPNCAHVIMPYIEELADDPEDDRINSNKPFVNDSKSQKEIDLYNEMRRKKQRLRENRRQWERYMMVLPESTPKTFQGFMNMKNAQGEKWTDLQSDYRYVLKLLRKENIIKSDIIRSLPMTAEPKAIKDLVDKKGNVLQRRVYDDKGRAKFDYDTNAHGRLKAHPTGAHAHDWDYSLKKPKKTWRKFTEEELRQNKDIIREGENYHANV